MQDMVWHHEIIIIPGLISIPPGMPATGPPTGPCKFNSPQSVSYCHHKSNATETQVDFKTSDKKFTTKMQNATYKFFVSNANSIITLMAGKMERKQWNIKTK